VYLALLSSVLLGIHPETTAHNVLALAMQTAISLGLHKKAASPPADIEFRNKIWWTIYNFDRPLSAALGRPLGIADSDIDADVSTGSRIFTGDVDMQLLSESDGDSLASMINTITVQRRTLSKIHTKVYSQVPVSDADRFTLEEEIRKWRASCSRPQTDEAGQTYFRLLSLQALCLLYGPTTGDSIIDPSSLINLGEYAQEALEIYQSSAKSSPELITLAWRYQIVITLLYTTADTNMDLAQISNQLEICRQIVSSGSNYKELERLRIAFEQLSELLMDGISPRTAGAADQILAGMYQPQVESGQGEEQDGERSLRVLEAGKETGVPRWDHLI